MSYCLNLHCQQPKNPDHHRFCQTCGNRLLLGDRYRAVQPLSRKAYIALDTRKAIDARCLIKVFTTPAAKLNSFRQDVAQLDGLGQHPQIPQLYAYFEREFQGRMHQQYLVREWIQGQTLQQALEEKGPFDESDILQVLKAVLPLLQDIHSHQVIHRDIKPTNLVQPPGETTWTLLDFGAAKHDMDNPSAQPGTVVGSAAYAAPEQLRGQATFASDLYSLGATCIHLLTGLLPFELYNALENRWMWRSVSSPVSKELGQVLDRLLQSKLNQRYTSAKDVLQDLDLEAPPAPPAPKALPSPIPSAKQSWTCTKTLHMTTEGDIHDIAFSPDGNTLAISGNDPIVYLWDMTDLNQPCQTLNTGQPISAMSFSANGRLLTGGWDGQIQLWNLNHVLNESAAPIHRLSGHKKVVTAMVTSPDGKLLISGSRDQSCKLWNLTTGKLIQTLAGPKTSVESLAISADDKYLATGQADGTVSIWHLPTHEQLRTLVGHRGMVSAVTIAHQKPYPMLISAGWDISLYLRNLSTGGVMHRLAGHLLPIVAMAIRPTESYTDPCFATASHDGTIKLWHPQTGMLLDTLSEHDGPVESVTFSPDGAYLVSAGQDQTLRIWQPIEA